MCCITIFNCCYGKIKLNIGIFLGFYMLHNIKLVYLHCVFHGIRFKVNEDWESGKIPFFYALYFAEKKRQSVLTETTRRFK